MTCTDLCTDLLPPQTPLHIETMAMTERGMTLDVAVTTSQPLCPTCTQPSTHIHSDYRRTLADLPWATTPVQLHLRVRRFWCESAALRTPDFYGACAPGRPVLRTDDRTAPREADRDGLGPRGGGGGAALGSPGVPGSRNTLLRRVRGLSTPAAPRPCAVGIDRWAKRKGHTYGTIVVDLDRHCPVDLLEDRTAETVAASLPAHPEVTVVARDRAEAYASGVAQGAPEAVQVARILWHLVKNLREAVEAELREHRRCRGTPPSAPAERTATGARPSRPEDPAPFIRIHRQGGGRTRRGRRGGPNAWGNMSRPAPCGSRGCRWRGSPGKWA